MRTAWKAGLANLSRTSLHCGWCDLCAQSLNLLHLSEYSIQFLLPCYLKYKYKHISNSHKGLNCHKMARCKWISYIGLRLMLGTHRNAPDLSKLTEGGKKVNTTYAVKEMCGWRRFMEDAFIAEDELQKNQACSLFAIFDGHAGADTAIFAARHFSCELQKHPDFRKYQYMRCLRDTFYKMDELMLTEQGKKELLDIQAQQFAKGNAAQPKNFEPSGTTALVCLITSNFVYIANAGDCRAIGSIKGELIQLSQDHRPSNIKEAKRINDAGGWIEKGRVNGDLSVSRGLGDFPYKSNKYEKLQNQMVTAEPDIKQLNRKDIDYIFLACDGLWETKSNKEMKSWLDDRLKTNSMDQTLNQLLDELVSKSPEQPRGMDNMTAILITLNNP